MEREKENNRRQTVLPGAIEEHGTEQLCSAGAVRAGRRAPASGYRTGDTQH